MANFVPPYIFFREQILFFVIVQTLTVTNLKKSKKNPIWCNLSKVYHRTHISVTIFYINIDRRINEQIVTSGVKSLLPPRHLQY